MADAIGSTLAAFGWRNAVIGPGHPGASSRCGQAKAAVSQGRRALECVRCQILVDPCDERLHRQRMQLYCALGQAELALASYQSLAQQLEKELGVLPDHDTAILAQCIQARVL